MRYDLLCAKSKIQHRPQNTMSTVNYSDGSFMLWALAILLTERRMDGAKYRDCCSRTSQSTNKIVT